MTASTAPSPKTALLIIDVQTALCSGEYEVFESGRILRHINQLSAQARSAGVPVVVIQHEEPGSPMAYGQAGWQLAPGLQVQPTDLKVRKTVPDAFHHTELQALLQTHGIERLVICGMQTEFCVESTTRRALELGYPVTLVSDAHSTRHNGVLTPEQIIAHHNATLGNMDCNGVRVRLVPTAEVGMG